MKGDSVAIILAAGFGTRLSRLTEQRPKPLMELANKTIIYYIIKNLEKAGIKNIFINLYHQGDLIEKSVRDISTTCNFYFSYEEQILGTAGGVSNIISKYDLCSNNLIIIHGDIFLDINLEDLLNLVEQDFCTLLCARGKNISGYTGNIKVDAQNNIISLGSYFSSSSDFVDEGFFTGVHLLSHEAVLALARQKSFGLVDQVYPEWLRRGAKIKALIKDFSYEDLGTPERLWQANMAIFDTPSWAGQPALIGAGAIIEEGAVIGPRAIIGERAQVKSGARVSNSVVMSSTVIEKDEVLDCALALLGARVLVK